MPVLPIQVPALKKLPFWGGWALDKLPTARVWIHDGGADAVHAGRDFYPLRVHLGIVYKADLSDVSQLTQPKLRECILLPRNVESSLERMDALAAALYAAGHKIVKWIDPRGQEDNWSWPGQLGKEEAVEFAKKHVRIYPNNAVTQQGEIATPAPSSDAIANVAITAAVAAPHAAPDSSPAASHPSHAAHGQPQDRGAASDTPKDSLGPRLERKRGNGEAGPPLTPPERAEAYLAQARAEVLAKLDVHPVSDVREVLSLALEPAVVPATVSAA